MTVNRALRTSQLLAVDLAIVAASILGAMALRYDSLRLDRDALVYFPAAAFPLLVRPVVNTIFGLYRRAWAYASIGELERIALAVAMGSVVGVLLFYVVLAPLNVPGTVTPVGQFPRSFFVLEGLLTLSGIGGVRFLIRALAEWRSTRAGTGGIRAGDAEAVRVQTLVFGAGRAGVQVLRTLGNRSDGLGMQVVGLLDDDPAKHGLVVRGIRVMGGLSDLELAVARTGARRLLVAMPSASGEVIRRVVTEANRVGLETRTLPPFEDLVAGHLSIAAIREIRVEDLLRREPVSIDETGLRELVAGEAVLVTGAGGSIGMELSRQVFDQDPRRLILLDSAEGPLYEIDRELSLYATRDSGTLGRAGRRRADLVTRLASVTSQETMEVVLRADRPVLVVHAAAYKHVPMMELHPASSVATNLGGTLATLRACVATDVARFVLVSTDKAVEPTSIMGASKRLAELAVAAVAAQSGRRYVAVRFGNVLGSSGSVVPLFQRQLAEGVPLTITDPEITRFFMTIPEAARLLLEAALMGESGDLFVLDMGKPIRILDLARDVARLAGRDPDSVPIQFIGLRPGEKLHEALFYDTETTQPTRHPKVIRVRPAGGTVRAAADPAGVLEQLDQLVAVGAAGRHDVARKLLFETLSKLEHR
jgi:FlaA1/EpsC-like NDP-sugar epimerase